uniref:Uncharacterized protein n=1 Tax=Tanacetum cinerariifolium TaxID=118510 RepID=A0A6L2LUU0_TANCI|nr:hypothetical protein [Tanacetum cinerariifolium]GEU99965.1 hypothetical protein [Tanacetum cinerariifolium]
MMGEPTMEEYMTKTQEDYGSRIAKPKFDEKAKVELKGQFIKQLRDNTFSGSCNEDANEHTKRVLEIADLFTIHGGAMPKMNAANAKKTIQEMVDHSQKWKNVISTRCRSSDTLEGLASIQAQLKNLGREIKKVNEKVYAAQVGRESCNGPHYSKDFPLKEEGNILEEA